jgi:hypothetical protein
MSRGRRREVERKRKEKRGNGKEDRTINIYYQHK